MVIKNDTYAVALPLVDINFHSAKEVLDAHVEKAEESGSVYFSTSNRLDPKKVKQVTKVILVNKSFSEIADLVGYKYFDEKSAPINAADYAPVIFSEDQDLHWLQLSNIREVSLDELNTFEMINKKAQSKHGGVGNYIKNTGRLQVFYAKKKANDVSNN